MDSKEKRHTQASILSTSTSEADNVSTIVRHPQSFNTDVWPFPHRRLEKSGRDTL